ncbi:BofC C-terminal domain-containing protein [Pseudalkalibacillus berkeleyi]|uniref:Intercompartmental signaling factor BofC n=1 Tax=Pseudalkalibacillus berkeleyi TaxID=1069813 RepID=A0ABS9GZB3_9BACL|nr:BofC C-terminal domain-containing protein [Pseudalkalibacillus berkeleyi]MCF6138079.1 intercompartmental signaling factor BofC [Pseudalkalibacillus berkeleyi]
MYVFLFYTFEDKVKANLPSQTNQENYAEVEAQTVTGPITVEVYLHRNYLDGNQSEEVVYETIWSMEDFWSHYADWQLVDQEVNKVIFEQDIDDISPASKINGFFGLTEEGILTIFNGRPHEDEVIQSFFQIDTNKLESGLVEELTKGIRVQSKQEYTEVLERYKPYTTNKE